MSALLRVSLSSRYIIISKNQFRKFSSKVNESNQLEEFVSFPKKASWSLKHLLLSDADKAKSPISEAVLVKIAQLAQLNLPAEKVSRSYADVLQIINWIGQIRNLDTSGILDLMYVFYI